MRSWPLNDVSSGFQLRSLGCHVACWELNSSWRILEEACKCRPSFTHPNFLSRKCSNHSTLRKLPAEGEASDLQLAWLSGGVTDQCIEKQRHHFASCWEGLEAGGAVGTEDEMVRWHHRLSGHAFEQTPGDSEGQGSLACCSPWDCKELDITYRLNSKREVEVWSSATTQSLALCTPLPLVSGMVIPWNETPSSSLPCAFTRAR